MEAPSLTLRAVWAFLRGKCELDFVVCGAELTSSLPLKLDGSARNNRCCCWRHSERHLTSGKQAARRTRHCCER